MKKFLSSLVAVAALTAGCGGESFAESDPKGYDACTEWAGYQKETDAENKMNGMLEVGDLARKASTKEIRDSVDAMFDEEAMEALEGTESEGRNFFMIDKEKFEAACEEAGFEF